jgi:hypothetical protein
LYQFGQYFSARKDSPVTFDRDQDLQGLSICLPLDYDPVRLQEMVDEGIVTMDRPPDLESCFRMLDLGRTDLVRVNDIVGWTMIDRLFETRTAFRMINGSLV